MLRSGVHATLAGVFLSLTIPLRRQPGAIDDESASPLHRLEHRLAVPVGFVIVPVFGLANAGVPFLNLPGEALVAPVTIGVGLGLLLGKAVGVFGRRAWPSASASRTCPPMPAASSSSASPFSAASASR